MRHADPIDVPLLTTPEGTETTIRAIAGGQPVLVVLMRHVDCPYCEVYLGRLARAHHELGRIVLVGHGEPDQLASHHAQLPPEFVLLADRDQELYRAWETRRLSRARELRIGWRSLPTLARHVARGGKVKRAGQDILELGGDIIVDASGASTWVRASQQPDDRPTIEQLAHHMHRAA